MPSSDRSALLTLFAATVFSFALLGNAIAQVPVRPGTAAPTRPNPRPLRKEPCWEVAGVSKATMQERRAISRQTRRETEAVCANPSLSIQQKRERIQQIHAQERHQLETLITPAQREAIRSCQESRGGGHVGGGGHLGGGGGPCGEISGARRGHPMNDQEEDDLPPNDTPKPN